MIKKFAVLAACVSFLYLWAGAPEASYANAPVVVELFTSQSCSSCPPADKFLVELSGNPNVIALSCHVTYWDHLNWKDTLSQEFCTSRQKRYSQTMRTSRVYTPQMIINGQIHFVGSKKRDISNFVDNAAQKNEVRPVSIQPAGQNQFSIRLPAVKRDDYRLWVIGYKKMHTENLRAGENRGRTVEYMNAAINIDTLGSWAGEAMTLSFAKPQNGEIDGLAIIAQRTTHGPIAAAGKIEF